MRPHVPDDVRNGRPAPPGGAARLLGAPNRNRFWADLLVEELVRQGVGLFCLAPGSRSSPLVGAVAAHPHARHLVHVDERGTAYAALGWARATGRPACWVTTSGTAAANGLPALVEASVDGVPLIALTADRPAELRQTGANQTIPQPPLFAPYVRWAVDLPAPSADVDPAFVLTTAAQAAHRARTPPGPVHLNVPFREPLAPDPDGWTPPPDPQGVLARYLAAEVPFTAYEAARVPAAAETLVERLASVERGVVVAGRLRTRAEGEAAARLARRLGWPLLPDVTSQVRLAAPEEACPFFDLVLGSPVFRAAHRPEAVVYVGARATSKRLGVWLAETAPPLLVVVRNDPERLDPDHRVSHRVQADVAAWCDAVAAALPPRPPSAWTAAWRAASDAVGAALAAHPQLADPAAPVSEPGTARAVARLLPAGHGLVLASSMPVRDADAFADPDGAGAPVAANRGASGIDGTVATAAGFARGLGRPATLLVGDLALLHDLNALALLRDADQPPVTVVAVNNDGGGIFHFLPIARHADLFEPFFGTPHGMDFAHAARQFGLAYACPPTQEAFAVAYAEAVASGHSTLLEVRTEREANRRLHADLLAAAVAAVEAVVPARAP